MVSIIANDGLERCTGFMISNDEIMTNDHCVDKMFNLTPLGSEFQLSTLPTGGWFVSADVLPNNFILMAYMNSGYTKVLSRI